MNGEVSRSRAGLLAVALVLAGCSSAASAPQNGPGTPQPVPPPSAQATDAPGVTLAAGAGVVGAGSAGAIKAAEKAAMAYTPADVDFMTGMVPHHAQAIVMCGWAESHGARADVARLCDRIVISQRDEIRMIRRWLGERSLPVPDSLSTKHVMNMDGMSHVMLMPGMMTDEQMAALDRARGPEFDYLLLTGMIRHHQGAIDMVKELYTHPNAGQEDTLFRFASDVSADQAAEIDRMQLMLETVPR